MKTVVAATDFSAAARNALVYAAEMAGDLKARLVLLHVYSVPVMVEAPLPAFTLDDLEKDCMKRLNRTAAAFRKKYGKRLVIETKCRCGFAVDEIKSVAKESGADLIVTGMQGAGALGEKINGSVTTALMSEADCPVMSIDRKTRYIRPKKIVLASDLKEIQHKDFVATLKDLSMAFRAKLLILNIFKPHEVMPSVSEATEGLKLDILLRDLKHSFHYIESNDVVSGINSFVKEHKADLVVMIGRKHSVLERIFREPQTKRMAFHTSAPLLVFRDQAERRSAK